MLEKFEGYIIRKKRKIDHKILSISFFFIFGIVVVFGMDVLVKFKKQKELVQDEYNRSMYEMVGYVKNVNTQLNKLKIASGDKVIITTLADIWRQSNLAKENLANLPVNQENMGNASKYLTQLSDYSYYLIEKVSLRKEISSEEYNNINNLSLYAQKLFNITSKIYEDVNSGRLKWDEVEKVASENLSEESDINLYSISKTFQDYAGLIYDGAFSEHILDVKPQMLSGNIISNADAENKIKGILGENGIEKLEYVGEVLNNIELYQYIIKIKDEPTDKNIYITKDSGLIYLMISDRAVLDKQITEKKAEEIGIKYLEKLGITNMESTYYYTQDNMMTINYASVINDVIMYPDLIKVKIALDTGEVCSIEAAGYIYNHKEREVNGMYDKESQAREVINKNLKIDSVRRAIIPTDAKEEVLVYEFKCSVEDKNYLVYINAETLEEEKILIMIETTDGILTM